MSEARPAEYRNFSASLRIFGEIPDLDAISSHLGVPPTYTHRRGERRSKKAAPFEHDAWIFEAPVAPDRPLDEHLLELWRLLKPHAAYLRGLKRRFAVDVSCGYRSSSDTAGFSVMPKALEIFTELAVPFGVSVIIA